MTTNHIDCLLGTPCDLSLYTNLNIISIHCGTLASLRTNIKGGVKKKNLVGVHTDWETVELTNENEKHSVLPCLTDIANVIKSSHL